MEILEIERPTNDRFGARHIAEITMTLTAKRALVGVAIILSGGNPAKVFAAVTASPTNISADQSTPTIPSTPRLQSTVAG
jgi:hypothetical protein